MTRGGASEKQIKFLRLLADRVGAEPAEELWREADPERLQAQIKAAIPFKDLKVKHTHAACEEVILRVGIQNATAFKDGVQRCECGAARQAFILRDGKPDEDPWTLSGYLVDYLIDCTTMIGPVPEQELAEDDDDEFEALDGRWAKPMTFSEVRVLYETAHKMTKEDECWSVGDCNVELPADRNRR